ncbi:MAG TPA: protein kinase [Candidatus Udaeobacter sp.]|nr:protein kinase [Candidatus Udaeobacter sp.]
MFESILEEAEVQDEEWHIGNYRVMKEIGRGGMGAVYLAARADQQYEKYVAIKLLKRGMDTDSVLDHFRNERQILASFDHPNIARLFDGGTTEDGLPYFVMEYVQGFPINDYCERLSVNERLTLFREVCAAVSHAHRHLVIHRDLKRSNILVTAEGVPKLLDFGIAKILQVGDVPHSLVTRTGARLMTPEYASPEQVRGEPVTTASDVYALGVILYELLTGKSPYHVTTKSPSEIEHAVTTIEPHKPSIVAKGLKSRSLRGDLDNIVLMALRKEPERRYRSVEQFSEDIRRHLQSLPIVARKDTIGYRTTKFVRRNKITVGAAALLFVTLLAGVVTTVWQMRRAMREGAQAERRFKDVRQLAHSVLFDYHDAIKELPGALRVRERLVKDTLTYLDSLSKEAGGDPDLQRELAAAYERVGDVRGERFSPNLGDRAGAVKSYYKARRIREALVAGGSGNVQDRQDLAANYEKIGNELLDTNQAPRGLQLFQKALAIYSRLAAEHPGEFDRQLAGVYGHVGTALEYRGDMKGALEQHRKALAIREHLVAANPGDRESRFELADSYKMIGRALYQSSDALTSAALDSNSKALALRQALVAEDPTNNGYRRELAIDWQNDGDYRAGLKDYRGALESFQKKIAIEEQSLAIDPANALVRGDFAYSTFRIGDLSKQLGNYSDAIQYYRRALEMYEKKLALDPMHQELPTDIIVIRVHLSEAEAKAGDFTSGRRDCAKAAELLNQTVDIPDRIGQRDVRANTFIDVGDAYATLTADKTASAVAIRQDWDNARQMYRVGLDLMQKLQASGNLRADERSELGAVAEKIARCDQLLAR